MINLESFFNGVPTNFNERDTFTVGTTNIVLINTAGSVWTVLDTRTYEKGIQCEIDIWHTPTIEDIEVMIPYAKWFINPNEKPIPRTRKAYPCLIPGNVIYNEDMQKYFLLSLDQNTYTFYLTDIDNGEQYHKPFIKQNKIAQVDESDFRKWYPFNTELKKWTMCEIKVVQI